MAEVKKKRTRGRRGKYRTMLETPDLRWKAGRQPKEGIVKGKPFNHRLVETDLGLVTVTDNATFQKGLKIPVWVEAKTGRLICKGLPRSLGRF